MEFIAKRADPWDRDFIFAEAAGIERNLPEFNAAPGDFRSYSGRLEFNFSSYN